MRKQAIFPIDRSASGHKLPTIDWGQIHRTAERQKMGLLGKVLPSCGLLSSDQGVQIDHAFQEEVVDALLQLRS